MRDAEEDVYRKRNNDATNRTARRLYLAAAVLFAIEVLGVTLSILM